MRKRVVFVYDSTVKAWHADIESILEKLEVLNAKGVACEVLDAHGVGKDRMEVLRKDALGASVQHHQRVGKQFGRGEWSNFGKEEPALLVYGEGKEIPLVIYPHEKTMRHERKDFSVEDGISILLAECSTS